MLNGALKKEALDTLKAAQARYEEGAKKVGDGAAALFELRRSSSEKIITEVEAYINGLANTPKEFDKTFSQYHVEFETFSSVIDQIEGEARSVALQTGSGAAAGVAAGVGVAAFAPTAAMAVATTFGVASTGTAISALSGAAATNAALAWLGGGALAAGGGGMVGGQALLALAGPVGWFVGGATLVGAGLFARSRNRKLAEQALAHTKTIETYIAEISAAEVEVTRLRKLTAKHVEGVSSLLQRLKERAPADYLDFAADEKEWLGALINHVRSLSKLLNKRVQG